jgi:hypothetical protein
MLRARVGVWMTVGIVALTATVSAGPATAGAARALNACSNQIVLPGQGFGVCRDAKAAIAAMKAESKKLAATKTLAGIDAEITASAKVDNYWNGYTNHHPPRYQPPSMLHDVLAAERYMRNEAAKAEARLLNKLEKACKAGDIPSGWAGADSLLELINNDYRHDTMFFFAGGKAYKGAVAEWKKSFTDCLKVKLDIALSQAPSGTATSGSYASTATQTLTLSLDWTRQTLVLDPTTQSEPTVITRITTYSADPGCTVIGVVPGPSMVAAEAGMDTKLVKNTVKLTSLIAGPSYDYPGSDTGAIDGGADIVHEVCLFGEEHSFPVFSVTQETMISQIGLVEASCFESQLANPAPRKSFTCNHVVLGNPADQAVYGTFTLSHQ